jgi:DNA-binding CsgD family transcriptional regulator
VDASTWREGDAPAVNQALLACSLLEDRGTGWALIEQLHCVARSLGSVGAEALAAAHRAILHARAGALADAETDLRRVLELDREHAVSLMLPLAFCLAADALLERPDLAKELAPVLGREFDDETLEGAMMHELRGRLALVQGSAVGAARELEQAAATYHALHLCSWRSSSWRSALALAIGHGGSEARRRAIVVAGAELADARRSQSPRMIGVALRAYGLLAAGSRAISYLEEAVAILEQAHAQLEHARALVELGAALRRANRRAAARAPLRAGLELAEICGAHRLRERALVELNATGARPRRAMLSGPAALTTAERRVAELAVAGLTNPEIARALFVTINTVEGHLRHVYQKLSIHSRRELADALQDGIAA